MSTSLNLSAAGFTATAISFGPGRMGFGLFVPEFRSEFAISASTVGLISSLGFLGFFLGLLIAQTLLSRRGPEAPVLGGLSAATLGMATIALAPSVPVLACGVFLASSSAGLTWSPFNDAVHRKVLEIDRPTALSRISTGTSIGVVAAGIAALVMAMTGLSWRACWGFFAVASALALLANWAVLRGVEKDPAGPRRRAWVDLLRPASVPLFLIAFVYGSISAVYIVFAGDHFQEGGGVPGLPDRATPALVFVFYGMFGLFGLLAGRAKAALGLSYLVRSLLLAGALSIVLPAILPGTWTGLVLSAGLQGVHVMMMSAVLAFWSERLFPSMPSLGFTAALLAMAAGSVLGPAIAGWAADAIGTAAMFLCAAALPVATAIFLRKRYVRERDTDDRYTMQSAARH